MIHLTTNAKSVLMINVIPTQQRRSSRAADQPAQGVVSAIQDDKLTVVFSVSPVDNEQTFAVGTAVKVFVDGKSAKLTDLKPGMRVRIVKNDQDNLVGVHAEGPTMNAIVKSIADGKITLDGRGLDRVCNVTAETKIMIDRQPGKLADLKPGTRVVVTFSVDRKTALTIFTDPPAGESRRLPSGGVRSRRSTRGRERSR